MKKTSTKKGEQRKPRPELKWQTGDYDRHAEFKFVLPYQFLLLCRLVDKTPEDIIRDFTDNLSCGSWKREGRDQAKEHLINYFIAHGYGQHHYSEEDIRQMFKEMDALGSLFPTNGEMKLIDLYADWRDKHHTYFFKKWFRKPRRKLSKKEGGMKPFTIYHLCKDAHSSYQQCLVDIIIKAAKPDMIFLLGASLYRRRSESIFQQSAPTSQHIADYVLLILMESFANKELHEWQYKIETHCKALIPVTTIVLQKTTFEEWLKEGHPFAINVQQSAVIIYNSGSSNLPVSQIPNHDAATNATEKHLTEGLTKAKEFLAGSELFRIRKQHAMAAFMLHQSAEQALRTLLKAGTGYHANTHSIDRLLRYAGLVSYQVSDIFPQQTEEEKRLFNLLQKAYIETRYKEDYKISTDDLLCLTEKVRRIHDILSDVGKIKLQCNSIVDA